MKFTNFLFLLLILTTGIALSIHIDHIDSRSLSASKSLGAAFMNKPLLKRLAIFSFVLISSCLVYYLLSEGRPTVPDASHYRNILYTYTLIIMPLIILCDVIYLFSVMTKKPIRTILISLILGVSAPALFIYSIKTSKDPMASMALIGIVIIYAVGCICIFVLLSVMEWLINRPKKSKMPTSIRP